MALVAAVHDLIYDPLEENQSRLVHLAPGNNGDPIHCTLQHFNVSNPPPYEALSYVWGDPDITAPIIVNGHTLPVTTNLEVALTHLRYQDTPRVLWIDAIAINQIDLKERAEQVALMADIYRRAVEVMVWLGPADAYSTLFLGYFKREGRKYWRLRTAYIAWKTRSLFFREQSKDWKEESRSVFSSIYKGFGKLWIWVEYLSSILSEDYVRRLGAHHLMRRAWFSRRWCIQEVILAERATVQCGAATIPWVALKIYFSLNIILSYVKPRLSFKRMGEPLEVKRLQSRMGAYSVSEKSRKYSLPELLYQFRHCQNGDPRDTIYALLSLADLREYRLTVDYTRPVIEVLVDVIEYAIRFENHLNLIGVAWAPPNVSGLPSWIIPSCNESHYRNGPGWYENKINGNNSLFNSEREVAHASAMNAKIIRLNGKATPLLAVPRYTLLADGITLETYGMPMYPSMDSVFSPVAALSRPEPSIEDSTERQYRKCGDRVVLLFGCSYTLLLRPFEDQFILIEAGVNTPWGKEIVAVITDDPKGPLSILFEALLRARPTETFAIV